MWQKLRNDWLRHNQTWFSSSWMPMRGSMKMTSLPREVWLPCRNLTHLVWAVPISWLPISTLMCLVWAPFLPGRRWGWSSPGPGWLLPSGWVPLFVFIFRNLLLLGFTDLVLSDFQLRGVTFNGNFIMGKCQDRSVGRIQRSPFWNSNSFGLTNIIILRCNHGIVHVLWVWIALPQTSITGETKHWIFCAAKNLFLQGEDLQERRQDEGRKVKAEDLGSRVVEPSEGTLIWLWIGWMVNGRSTTINSEQWYKMTQNMMDNTEFRLVGDHLDMFQHITEIWVRKLIILRVWQEKKGHMRNSYMMEEGTRVQAVQFFVGGVNIQYDDKIKHKVESAHVIQSAERIEECTEKWSGKQMSRLRQSFLMVNNNSSRVHSCSWGSKSAIYCLARIGCMCFDLDGNLIEQGQETEWRKTVKADGREKQKTKKRRLQDSHTRYRHLFLEAFRIRVLL